MAELSPVSVPVKRKYTSQIKGKARFTALIQTLAQSSCSQGKLLSRKNSLLRMVWPLMLPMLNADR